MVVVSSHVMYQCHAFYLGSEIPTESKRGVEGLQQPMRSLYRGDVSQTVGYDVNLTIFPEYVHVKYNNDTKPAFSLPISTLSICAACRCVDGDEKGNQSHSERARKFVPVHSVLTDAEPDTGHPAVFAAVFRRTVGKQVLDCHAFICNSTRDALHLVNATQTAHAALRKGFIGNTKFFVDKRTEFDKTLRVSPGTTNKKVFLYNEDYDTRPATRTDTRIYSTDVDIKEQRRSYISTDYDRIHQTTVNTDGENTYYIKTGDYRPPTPEPAQEQETIFVKMDAERTPTPPPQQQSTIVIDQPIIRQSPIEPALPPKIIENPVYIDAPKPRKIEPPTIYVDKPIFNEIPEPEPYPAPKIIENPVYIDLPQAKVPEATTIIVDKPMIRNAPTPPPCPKPIITENPVYIDLPEYPPQEPPHIIVDKPIIRPPPPPPAPPKPVITEREVFVEMPEFPKQDPYRICIEKPVFRPAKPAPPPPKPIIQEKIVYIDPPEYPRQVPPTIIVEKPVIKDPGPRPPQEKPKIIEKPVYIDGPKYEKEEPITIIVEKPVIRSPGPPPPRPPPIIIEKVVYIDPEPWPEQEPQRIVIEKPIVRSRGPQPPPKKPIIIEKPVYVDLPQAAPPPAQRIVVEKPIFRESGRLGNSTSAYNYNFRHSRPYNVQSAQVQRSAPRGLRRYAWSEVGDSAAHRYQPKWEYRNASSYHGGYTSGARLYGQPRDFRRTENQFINERGFARRINEENRYSRGANSYTYGSAYRLNEYPPRRPRSDSVSS